MYTRADAGPQPLSLPRLVLLQGRIDDQTLREAVAAVRRDPYGGWHILMDRWSLELAGPRSWLRLAGILAEAGVGLLLMTATPRVFGSTRAALRVRTIVLEYALTRQRTTVRFQRLDRYGQPPHWLRL